VEGFARIHKKVMRNFLEIAYGSLKESRYLLYFSYRRNYIKQGKLEELEPKADRIGKMLWGIIEKL
jgi:four helix bundle protein